MRKFQAPAQFIVLRFPELGAEIPAPDLDQMRTLFQLRRRGEGYGSVASRAVDMLDVQRMPELEQQDDPRWSYYYMQLTPRAADRCIRQFRRSNTTEYLGFWYRHRKLQSYGKAVPTELYGPFDRPPRTLRELATAEKHPHRQSQPVYLTVVDN